MVYFIRCLGLVTTEGILMAKRKRINIQRFARMLRFNMTLCEKKLWIKLQHKSLKWGIQFKPQVIVHGYIPDFCCEELKLCIEVDGGIHKLKRVIRNDKKKDCILRSYGYTIIRVTNKFVDSDLNGVVSVVERVIVGLKG